MATKRGNPLAGKAQRDSVAAEARFQAGRSAALASMNKPVPKPSALESALKGLGDLFGAIPKALDAMKKKS